MALSSCPECRKEISDKAWNCPHCGWHKSRAGLIVAWIIAIVIIALGVLFYYQINESNKAFSDLRKDLDKPVEIQKKLAP